MFRLILVNVVLVSVLEATHLLRLNSEAKSVTPNTISVSTASPTTGTLTDAEINDGSEHLDEVNNASTDHHEDETGHAETGHDTEGVEDVSKGQQNNKEKSDESNVESVTSDNENIVMASNSDKFTTTAEATHGTDDTEHQSKVADTTTTTTTTTTPTTPATTETVPPNADDVDPLGIFVSDIKYQRFPKAMKMDEFREKVLGKRYKKLYILEETSDKKVFGMVRQLESVYTMKNNSLYVSFLFRFIFSRKCMEIDQYRLGDKAGDEELATFEKKTKDDNTERLVFFSDYPSEYLYLMSCTDVKTSPYACRDKFYLTLESSRDPPNSFKWFEAAQELKEKMDLTFDDPRFMFNFVMTPCVWKGDN